MESRPSVAPYSNAAQMDASTCERFPRRLLWWALRRKGVGKLIFFQSLAGPKANCVTSLALAVMRLL